MVAFSFLTWFVPFILCRKEEAIRTTPPPLKSQTFSPSRLAATAAVLDEDLRLTIREAIAEADNLEAWDASIELVADLLLGTDVDAERLLAECTRWMAFARAGKLARKYIRPASVNPEQIKASLDWLKQEPLALSSEQIVEFVRQYPHLYLLDPAEAFRKVMGAAPRKYRDQEVIRAMLLEDPSVLQYSYNCDNDCASECGSCWVTLQNRL